MTEACGLVGMLGMNCDIAELIFIAFLSVGMAFYLGVKRFLILAVIIIGIAWLWNK